MKRRNLSLTGKVILCLFLLIFIASMIIWQYFPNKNLDEINIIEETPGYVLKIDYPVVNNKKIDKMISKYVEEKRKEFILLTEGIEKDVQYDFKLNYMVEEIKDVKSIHLTLYSFTGGAHYAREDKVFRFKKDSFEIVDITYFLEEDSFADLSSIAYDYVLKYFKENEETIDEEWIKSGTEPKVDNYNIFSFKDDGFEITFVPYQVGPWSSGEIKILIPYTKLKGILKKEYLNIEEKEAPVIAKKPNERNLDAFKDKKLIAFTFDDGPGGSSTKKLLDNLEKYNARVSFFVLGSRVNNYKDNLKRAYEMGNTIGSHTYNHFNLYKLEMPMIKEEIDNTNLVIENVTGEKPIFLRPPYGNTNNEIKEESNMYTILWNIDSLDWKKKNAQKIADEIVSHARDGAIILLHDIYMTSVDGALMAMEKLQAEGYAFVSIEEMIKLKNTNLEILKSYYSF